MASETFPRIKMFKSMYIVALLTGIVSSLALAETYPDLNGCYRCFNDNCSNSNQYAKIVQNSPEDLVFYNERRPSFISSGKFISENRVMAYSYRSNECGPPMIATLSYYPTTTLNWCNRSVWVKQVSCDWSLPSWATDAPKVWLPKLKGGRAVDEHFDSKGHGFSHCP